MDCSGLEKIHLDIGLISCYAFNKDRTKVAVSSNTNEVFIYALKCGDWVRTDVFKDHNLRVTGIDWAPETNRIVTCAQDKTAYVYNYNGEKWIFSCVVARLYRAATCVKWSPSETKFAIGSCSKVVAVCSYVKETDWWVAKPIRKQIYSMISSVDWHPNNVLLAVGGMDFRTRVYSAYMKELDGDKPIGSCWSVKNEPFGTLLAEYTGHNMSWINAVKFSPSGDRLCWVSHNSTIYMVDSRGKRNLIGMNSSLGTFIIIMLFSFTNFSVLKNRRKSHPKMVSLKTPFLPFSSVIWLNNDEIVAGGFNCFPVLYRVNKDANLEFVCNLDLPSTKKSAPMSPMVMFKNLESRADSSNGNDIHLKTLHQSAITQIRPHTTDRTGNVSVFSSAAYDGLLILWDANKLKANSSVGL
ncbi:Actin-related protein 2/3 complex subunit 1A [Trichinella nelsoni]|uniref:Arp2/3 complex 41 kDa subunit n=1 Tax=Trichinella nelsoni TaxID=6336 RepID=A0A0V0SBV4_9BILA|nr:Actin-related protein 2/3 complex subunit 1A [Trichinella nelsoni]